MFTQEGVPGGIVQTESVLFTGDTNVHPRTTTQVPVVATEARKVHLESDDGNYEATGEIVSSQTISSKTRTVETITVSASFRVRSYTGLGSRYTKTACSMLLLGCVCAVFTAAT